MDKIGLISRIGLIGRIILPEELMRLRKEDALKALTWFREEEIPLLKRLAQGDPERMAEVEAFEQDVEESFAYLAE